MEIHVAVSDVLVWAEWMERTAGTMERRVAFDNLCGCDVSTVFLGLDHGFGMSEKPLVYETMVFGGDLDYQDRYSTREEALEGHARAVAWVKENRPNRKFREGD